MSKFIFIGVALALSFICTTQAAFASNSIAESYPLRKEFKNVVPIEESEVFKNYSTDLIVDVRSQFEFDVVHIAKSTHLPMNNKSLFLRGLEAIRSKSATTPIVMYCNGVKCRESYEAASFAMADGFKNVFVLDAGIFAWLKSHPAETFFLGKIPADPNRIISREKFQSYMVDFASFEKAAKNDSAIIFDVRDATQQKKVLNLPDVKRVQLDNTLPLLKKGSFKDKNLYFVDSVGKQVEWLQYYLEEYGYKNYHFLKDGADTL